MTISRQLAPTVGPVHGGFEFLMGSFEGLKGYVLGWMTKTRHGKLYIDDVGWGPETDSNRVRMPGPLWRNSRFHRQDW